MKVIRAFALAVLALTSFAAARGAEPTAEELVRKILSTRTSVGELIRAKLEVADTATDQRSAVQLRIKIRHDGDATRILYQVLWPTERMGEAIYLESDSKGISSGFLFERPDTVTQLTPALISGPLLGSDLNIEDLSDSFWRWPTQTISGRETIDREPCTIIESRTSADSGNTSAFVRSWVSTSKSVPLRIEKVSADGKVIRRFLFKRMIKSNDIWVPRTMIVQTPGSTRETTLEISRGDRDFVIPLDDFSIDAIRKFAVTGDDKSGGDRRGPSGK